MKLFILPGLDNLPAFPQYAPHRNQLSLYTMNITKRMQAVLNNAKPYCTDYQVVENVRIDILNRLDNAGLTYMVDHGTYQETWLTVAGIAQRNK